MHVVVVRRDVYERHRWVAQSLYKALLLAKQEALSGLYDSSALRFMLPRLNEDLELTRALLGRPEQFSTEWRSRWPGPQAG